MTITNGYATLEEVKAELVITDTDSIDDSVLERCIEDASRWIDGHCGGRRFYAEAASAALDCPTDGDRVLWLNDDWLAVSAITNGDGSTVAASLADLWPRNAISGIALRLKDSSGLSWTPTAGGDYLGAITVSGSTGYVNRAATDGKSSVVISNTKRACIITAIATYKKRFGIGSEAATVTAAGVVLMPQGLPKEAAQLLDGYRSLP